MMYRFLDISLIVCFSVSLMFVGVESMSELPPPKNLNFKWETPFTLNLTWDKPEDLDPECLVNYTISVSSSLICSNSNSEKRRVATNKVLLNVSNVNGLCINVTTNFDNCGDKRSPPQIITIPPPPVLLVKDRDFAYSHNKLMCTWRPAVDVKDLGFYYWDSSLESLMRCIPDDTMKMGGCVIHNKRLKEINVFSQMFYLFNGTYNGTVVNNTFRDESAMQYVRLKKPQLTVQRVGDSLMFQTNASDLDEFEESCYKYNYTYNECGKESRNFTEHISKSTKQFDQYCKYKARVQIHFSSNCGRGFSELSDEVEYGENSNPSTPALLALIIIPLMVSCCLIVSLVLLRRNKDILFPKVPGPSLFFKEMLNNSASGPQGLQANSPMNIVYDPTEETVEYNIILEDTSLMQSKLE
ncbi:interleukin-13 receptor subunit alpha-1 precursor [Danio rerio]|uniref:Interleukin 13 receptor alpha 1 n=1 Tax=Danio rerio TaxID=7955 RepID=A8WH86_DANRE|nr:interleukin-13 receptor subunit alpha-1 precursor [Danio rerio]CAI94933.1 TPA: interleukin 13 receptor alpha 1 [Danio rerio]|eukprot:NP_001104307.1 interleukin 13 receptor, alpha 1 precursor [Danio rerio]